MEQFAMALLDLIGTRRGMDGRTTGQAKKENGQGFHGLWTREAHELFNL